MLLPDSCPREGVFVPPTRVAPSGIVPLRSQAGQARLSRILQLIVALQGQRYPSARELAEMLDVSRRTVYRDFTALESAGLPVQYDAERQGYSLASSTAFHGLAVDEKEATALLVLAEGEGRTGSLGLAQLAHSGIRKVIAALHESSRARVHALAEMLVSRQPVLQPPPERSALYDLILDALRHRRQIRIWYHDPGDDRVLCTKVSPYRLVCSRHHWTLIGRSSMHRGVAPFRLARIERAEVTGDPAPVPPRFRLDRYVGQSWSLDRGADHHKVRLRFSAQMAPEVSEVNWHSSQRIEHLPDGRLDLILEIDGMPEIVGWILGFGDQVEVLEPARLRALVREQAQRIAERYATEPQRGGADPSAFLLHRKRNDKPEVSMGS